jgi:hypothetical protein
MMIAGYFVTSLHGLTKDTLSINTSIDSCSNPLRIKIENVRLSIFLLVFRKNLAHELLCACWNVEKV